MPQSGYYIPSPPGCQIHGRAGFAQVSRQHALAPPDAARRSAGLTPFCGRASLNIASVQAGTPRTRRARQTGVDLSCLRSLEDRAGDLAVLLRLREVESVAVRDQAGKRGTCVPPDGCCSQAKLRHCRRNSAGQVGHMEMHLRAGAAWPRACQRRLPAGREHQAGISQRAFRRGWG